MRSNNSSATDRVAIVGSGIAGSAAAYFARVAFGSDLSAVVFEQSAQIGGRIQHRPFAGAMVETGATLMHSSNAYLSEFIDELELKQALPHNRTAESPATVGIWNGEAFAFKSHRSELRTAAKMFGRYGRTPVRIRRIVKSAVKKWVRIYDLQRTGRVYSTPEEMFTELGLYQLCKEPSRAFFAREGIADSFVREFIDGISRNNYGQDSGIHALVNLFSLAGAGFAGGHLFSVMGGNSQVCERLLKRANADVRAGNRVIKIAVDSSNPKQYSITTTSGSEPGFDAVIIATPLELASIEFEGAVAEDLSYSGRSYQVTHATLVAGDLNAEFFEAQSTSDLPDTILTTENPRLWFSSVGRIGTSSATRHPIYKVFSRETLTDEQISELFAKPSEVERFVWRAYPVLKPSQQWPPFRLGRRIYYANAMESAVSTMETEAVAGRNVVGLLRQDFS
ncbi:MAG TPA: FAD-dependent oxidoreductase [Blastocatellia bacterium]|nr:FAD-dependent oxidoreductase [Blastocatellia bacterium]